MLIITNEQDFLIFLRDLNVPVSIQKGMRDEHGMTVKTDFLMIIGILVARGRGVLPPILTERRRLTMMTQHLHGMTCLTPTEAKDPWGRAVLRRSSGQRMESC